MRSSGYRREVRLRPARGRSDSWRMPLIDRAFQHALLRIAGDRDHQGPRGSDRGVAERDAGDGGLGRQRIGHHAQRAALLRTGQCFGQVGAGEDRRGMAVRPHAEQAQVERPVQVLQPCVRSAAGGLVIRGLFGGQRDDPRALGQEDLGETGHVRQRIAHRHDAVVGGDDRHPLPVEFGLDQPVVDRGGGAATGQRDHRRAARVDRRFDDELDVAGQRVGKFGGFVIFPPFDLGHSAIPCGCPFRSSLSRTGSRRTHLDFARCCSN